MCVNEYFSLPVNCDFLRYNLKATEERLLFSSLRKKKVTRQIRNVRDVYTHVRDKCESHGDEVCTDRNITFLFFTSQWYVCLCMCMHVFWCVHFCICVCTNLYVVVNELVSPCKWRAEADILFNHYLLYLF